MAKSKDKLANLAIELSLQNEQFIKAIGASTKRLEQINQGTKKAAQSLNVMERGFKAIAVAAASFYVATRAFGQIKGLVEAEEKIVNLEKSFTALLGSAEAGADMLQRVFGIVESTGVAFDSAATSVQRLAIGLTEIGASNDQIAKIAENFIKLGRVSGTAMQDINGALIQFTQGLASGRLQGDELRSIFERLPQVIQLIAKEMGIATGEVRKMGSEGKITADIMANALLNATEDINSAFETLEFTAEQTFNIMAAEWTKTSAIISQSLGFGDSFKGLYEISQSVAQSVGNLFIELRVGFELLKLSVLELGQTLANTFSFLFDNDQVKLDFIGEAIDRQKDKVFEVLAELASFQAGLEGVITDQVEAIDVATKVLSKYETTVLNAADASATLEEKLDILNRLYKEGEITLEQYNKELEKASKVYKDLVVDSDPLKEYNETLKELELLLEKGIISIEEFANASADAMIKLTKQTTVAMTDMEKQMQRLAADGVSDLVDVILEADRSFSDFAENFLRQIAKMIIQQQILNALKGTEIGSFFGFAKGGAFSSPTGLPQGIYNSPTFFPMPESNGLTAFAKGGTFGMGVMGEAGAEAIVPLRRGMNGDLGVQSSPVNVVINNNTSDTADVYAESTIKEDGSKQIEIMVERKVKESLGNGALDKSFSTNYGLKRRAM
jgi:tape measure domain-containing protein